jgi:ATPase subunit of ABC transporter with duplicated ATPase domains
MAIRKILLAGLILSMAATAGTVRAQQNASPSAVYDSAREVTLVGTIVSYSTSVDKPPLGAHLILSTSAWNVDVHLGDPRFLAANKFQIQSGDSIRIIGENVTNAGGTQFLARLIQKGTQALMLRSARGIPLSYAAPHKSAAAVPQGGAK